MIQEQLFFSELFEDIQDAILLIPSLQDKLVIQSKISQQIYHIGCTFNLHSIINSGLILAGQTKEQETDSGLPAY